MRGPRVSPKPINLFSRTTLLVENRWANLFLAFALVLTTVAIYYPVQNYAFFNVDDPLYVYKNPHVLGPFNWSTIKWAFTHTFVLNYDPLTFLAHNLNVQLFQLNVSRHHQINLVMHALDAVLLFWVLRRATRFTGRSFMVAALFTVHPMNVENVAWISELKTMLSAAFFFLALGAYQWYARSPTRPRMAVVAVLYGLGLLAKPQIITLPFVLLLWDYWPLQRMFPVELSADRAAAESDIVSRESFPALVREKIPLFIIAAADAVITMFAEHKASPKDWPYTLSIRLGNAILSYARYVGKAFWPLHLAYLYPHPGNSLRWGQMWVALLFLIAVSALVIAQKRRRYLAVGWFWFVGTMVPMIGLVQIDTPALADRWAYVCNVGLFLMVCWAVAEWTERWGFSRIALAATGLAILVLLSVRASRQVAYWSDSVTIWTHTLDVTHRNWIAEMNLGALLHDRGQTEKALAHYCRAAEEEPANVDVNLTAAFAEHENGNLRQEIRYYENVLAVSKDDQINAQVWANMGHAYSRLGDHAHAKVCYQAALRIHPIPPLPPPRPFINWQGDWWHDLGSLVRERFQTWKSKLVSSD
jgi:protein O-mannosyl-transferase